MGPVNIAAVLSAVAKFGLAATFDAVNRSIASLAAVLPTPGPP
jgi:hypothetical protein